MTIPAYLSDPDRYEHGERTRYVRGCRCADCRAANSRYYHANKGRPSNPLVPAARVKRHLARLTKQGVGLRAVADASDVSRSILSEIRRGGQAFIRKQSADRVLGVDAQAVADGAFIDAAETKRLLQKLIDEGYPKTRIAKGLGSHAQKPSLQIRGGKVMARTAMRVRRLFDALTAEGEDIEAIGETPRARILRALPWHDAVTAEELFDSMSVEAEDRDRYMQALHRLWKAGEVERLGAGKPYKYRMPVARSVAA